MIFVIDALLVILIGVLIVVATKRRNRKKSILEILEEIASEDNVYGESERTKLKSEPVPEPDASFSEEERKGFEGERELFNQIRQVQRVGAKVIWNCWLRFPNGTITQADVILIWKSGIYVIESKNWTGCRIYGETADDRWTVCWFDYQGKVAKTVKKYNPIKQNAMHVECIRKMLFDIAPIYSIIAFPDSCKLAKVPDKTGDTAVINYSELRQTIADFHQLGCKDKLLIREIDLIYDRLTACHDGVTQAEIEWHNNRIKKNYSRY